MAKIINRYDFVDLDHLECKWWLSDEEGRKGDEGTVDIAPHVGPGQTADLQLPDIQTGTVGEAFVNLSFCWKKPNLWADAGFEIATAQIPVNSFRDLRKPAAVTEAALKTELSPAGTDLTVATVYKNTAWNFDIVRGLLTSWTKDGVELFSSGPIIDFWRAPTDNDGE